mgnify:FL=1
MDKGQVKVKVYTTPTCPYCAMTKDFLKKHGVAFEEIDVASNRGAAMKMISKTGQMGVPVIEIGSTTILGFNKEAIKKTLSIEE